MYNNNFNIDRLTRQKEEIENMINTYKTIQNQPNPINNFINTNQNSNTNLFEWRVLNENEEVDNLYVKNKTLFVGDKNMVLKDVDGKLEKWEIKKVYPIDKKDEKINMLEEEIKKLKEMINNESKQSNGSTREFKQSDESTNVDVESESKTISKFVSKQKQSGTSTNNS